MEDIKEVKVEKKPGNIWWSPQMDKVLVDALYEQFLAGEKPDRTLSALAHEIILSTVIEKTQINMEKSNVKNRIKTLRNNFNTAYDIFKGRSSGFSWNPETCVMDAEDEVWEELIKENKKAPNYQGKPIPHFGILEEIYSKDRANGVKGGTAKERKRKLECSRHADKDDQGLINLDSIDGVDAAVADDIIKLEPSTQEYGGFSKGTKIPPNLPSSSSNQKNVKLEITKKINESMPASNKKLKIMDTLAQNCDVMKDGLDKLSLAIKEGNASIEKFKRVYSENEIWQELELLGLDEDLLFDAYEVLARYATLTRCFLGLPVDKRLTWLKKKISSLF